MVSEEMLEYLKNTGRTRKKKSKEISRSDECPKNITVCSFNKVVYSRRAYNYQVLSNYKL